MTIRGFRPRGDAARTGLPATGGEPSFARRHAACRSRRGRRRVRRPCSAPRGRARRARSSRRWPSGCTPAATRRARCSRSRASRTAATRLRDRIALRIEVPTNGPLARTATSLAFQLVGERARSPGEEPPRLLTGGEQDQIIAELLDGHLEDGTGPHWPEPLGRRGAPAARLPHRAARTDGALRRARRDARPSGGARRRSPDTTSGGRPPGFIAEYQRSSTAIAAPSSTRPS